MKKNKTIKHDRKWCKEKVFRGKDNCSGYSIFEDSISCYVCPCVCHAPETYEETLARAKKELNLQ